MSPASGNANKTYGRRGRSIVSIRLMSPASGNGIIMEDYNFIDGIVSIRLMSPASGNPCILNPYPVRSLEALSEVQET